MSNLTTKKSQRVRFEEVTPTNEIVVYFDRSKGERWDNLQKSIECYDNSVEVFTQDKFPAKWQINQEDLSQSQEALKNDRIYSFSHNR